MNDQQENKKNSEGKDGSSKPDITPTAKAGQELQGQEGTRRALHYMHSNPSIHPSIQPIQVGPDKHPRQERTNHQSCRGRSMDDRWVWVWVWRAREPETSGSGQA